MSVSLSTITTIVTGVSAIASGVVSVYENGVKLLEILKAAIEKVEETYASLKATGATKKALVLAVLEAAADAMGEVWTNMVDYFSALIDSIVDLYNTAKSVVDGTYTSTDTTADTSTETATTAAA